MIEQGKYRECITIQLIVLFNKTRDKNREEESIINM